MAAQRVPADQVQQRMRSGSDTMLVCAYEEEEKCRQHHLEGSITVAEFRAQQDQVPKDREIVFYCA